MSYQKLALAVIFTSAGALSAARVDIVDVKYRGQVRPRAESSACSSCRRAILFVGPAHDDP